MRIKSRHEIDKALWENVKRLKSPGWHFLLDANADSPELFEKAELKVLVVFLSDGEARSVSSTDLALYSLVKKGFGDRVFMDFCYFPNKEDWELLDEINVPWMIGDISHAPASDYDVVLISNSIVNERSNLFVYYRKSDIEPWANKRLNDESLPLFLLGGSAVAASSSLYGYSLDGTGKSMVDEVYIGFAEGDFERVISILLQEKEKGNIRKKRILMDRFYEIPCMFSPLDYEYVYEKEGSIKIAEIKKLNPLAPNSIKLSRPDVKKMNEYPGFSQKILHNEGSFDSIDEIISWGCSSGGGCNFCVEGNVLSWREVPLEKQVEKMRKAKKLSFASSYNSYSYNTPYHSQLVDILYASSQTFDSLSTIAFRADICAARPDFVKLIRNLGGIRQTIASEGVSERLRNGYLNKNLSEDELMRAIKVFFQYRFVQLKLFFILTGLEEKEDYVEFWNFFDRVLKMRDEMGAKTSFVLSFTPLAYQPHTPLQYEERRTCSNISGNIKKMGEFIGEVRKRGVRIRFSTSGKEPLYSQILLDFGPLFTKYYELMFDKENYIFSGYLSDRVITAVWTKIKEMGFNEEELWGRRAYDFIFPEDLIEVNSKEYLIRQHKKLVKFESTPMCLATAAKPKSPPCQKCEMCSDNEEIKYMRSHIVDQSKHSVDDILVSISTNQPRYRYRAVFDVPSKYQAFKKKQFAHYLLSKTFEKESEKVSRIMNDPFYWSSQNFQVHFYGKYMVDMLTKEKLDLENYRVPEKSILTLTSIKEVPLNSSVKVSDYAMLLVSFPYNSQYVDKIKYLPNDIFPQDDSSRMGIKWVEFRDPLVNSPMFKFSKDKVFMLLDFPLKANVVKKYAFCGSYNYKRILGMFDIRVLGYYSRAQLKVCRSCGKNRTFMDLLSNQISEYCPQCLGKVVLSKI